MSSENFNAEILRDIQLQRNDELYYATIIT